MSLYTPQNMILAAGIIACILLVVVMVFKKEKFESQLESQLNFQGGTVQCQYYEGGPMDTSYEVIKQLPISPTQAANAMKNNNCQLITDGGFYKNYYCKNSPCTPITGEFEKQLQQLNQEQQQTMMNPGKF